MTTTTCRTCRGAGIVRNPKTLKWATCPDCKGKHQSQHVTQITPNRVRFPTRQSRIGEGHVNPRTSQHGN